MKSRFILEAYFSICHVAVGPTYNVLIASGRFCPILTNTFQDRERIRWRLEKTQLCKAW